MERTLFSFIWKHSKRDQILLLGVTLLSFPLVYATLELPKRIINDAIGATETTIFVQDFALTQLQFLALLCAGFLLAVIASGMMKMQINIMKGVLAERLLRRFRFELISRILRFPQPYFRRTSQGELISMVTSEAEPLGGVMGDAVAQPVFQAGQMITILTFLFVQNVWLGLAAVALIPLQAWLIPMLQRRINLLNKARVKEVRQLAEYIGESVSGVGELRTNGGFRRTLADMTARLGRLFEIRYKIYRQKFFMKFLNNFITQLTPFFFFSIGGYLAIEGDLTVGALVAALAAYKDLSGPWKELLTYYNQVQDMSLRYQIVTERFVPRGMIDPELFEGEPSEIPSLAGPIEIRNVTVREPDGMAVLENISASIPAGAFVGVRSRSDTERRALAELLAREVMPASGSIEIAGQDLSRLHQRAVAARIGHAGPRPYLFRGTIGDNVLMGLRVTPQPNGLPLDPHQQDEARRTGNSPDPVEAEWLDVRLAGLQKREELRSWWMKLTEAMGTDMYLFDRGLDTRIHPDERPHLAERLVALRPEIDRRIAEAGVADTIHRFDPQDFNEGLAVGGNLLFAAPRRRIDPAELAADPRFLPALRDLGLEEKIQLLGAGVLGVLARTFGEIGTSHPLFERLGLDAESFDGLMRIDDRMNDGGIDALAEEDRMQLMLLPFRLSAEQIGDGFPETLKQKILEIRAARGAELRQLAQDAFCPIEPGMFAGGLTVLENAIFGKVVLGAGARATKVRKIVMEVLEADGLKTDVAELIFDVEVGIGGAGMPQIAQERIAFIRAAIKRPDVLVLDNALASHDKASRARTREKLRELLPETTLIFLEEKFNSSADYDVFLEIENGRLIETGAETEAAVTNGSMSAGLEKKRRALRATSLFANLDRGQLRLLAFASKWFKAQPGERIFTAGEPADAAYLIVEGEAELVWPITAEGEGPLTVVEAGRLIGDLSVIRGTDRLHHLVVTKPVTGLRIGAEELRAVIESDNRVAMSLLSTVSGYLIMVSGRLHEERQRASDEIEP